ncbi:MAG: AAA family ATPase [Eubacterium sp.]|nr:AAA family ATPase [Eubacterium sp.]
MRCLDMSVAAPVKLEPEEGRHRDRDAIIGRRISDLAAMLFSHDDEGLIYASVYRIDEEFTSLSVCMCPDIMSLSELYAIVEKSVNQVHQIAGAKIVSCQEITVKKYKALDKEADSLSRYHSSRHLQLRVNMDYFDDNLFRIRESVIESGKLSKKKAQAEAGKILADKTLYEEIERIYDPINEEKFYGHPVHYRIKTGSGESAMAIVQLIVRMLKSRKRIPSDRITRIFDVTENCYNDNDLKYAIQNAQGTAVAIELCGSKGEHGNYATSYEAVVRDFADLIEKYHHNTLFFFIENTVEPGFSPDLIAKVADFLDIVDIEEGTGTVDDAIAVLHRLIRESKYSMLGDDEDDGIKRYLPKKRQVISYHDIYTAFDEWQAGVLKEKVYRSYQKCRPLEIKKEKTKESAYDRLQNMIGLCDVKRVTDQIISVYKLQELRKKYHLEDEPINRHMIFTGNPGSAKTTVARLLADILTEEHVLKTGCLVECGRADLVGRYVGWTAREVEAKFRKARGGILFIDEAYSLVDDRSGSFGDEAINTIVQMMENYRDEVIVIFAGYTDRMESFLKTNEGLRSRIAFHLDFPDYQAEELWQILELMIREHGYTVADGIREKCLDIFSMACVQDDYGNGRFVRNFLEQALLKQAIRLMPTGEKAIKPSKKKCRELIAEDFDVDLTGLLDEHKKNKSIGFL